MFQSAVSSTTGALGPSEEAYINTTCEILGTEGDDDGSSSASSDIAGETRGVSNSADDGTPEPFTIRSRNAIDTQDSEVPLAAPQSSNNHGVFTTPSVSTLPRSVSMGGLPSRNPFRASEDVLNVAKKKSEPKEPFSVRLVPVVDHAMALPVHYAKPTERRISQDCVIRVGRVESTAPGNESMTPIVFKSKVVSRTHAELVLEKGVWYIRDVASSSGTFLNNTRLSQPNKESPKCKLENGDMLQLGLNFRGGVEEVFQCVKVRVELNYSWQRRVSEYNVESLRKLREQFSGVSMDTQLQECSICLMGLLPSQPMFISPCSHGWHYRCIRPLLVRGYPQFTCPNCRGIFDLENEDEE